MHLQPLKDQVIIRPLVRAEGMKGGVIIPAVERESTCRGVVVAVGPRCHELRAGDEVLFERYGSVRFAVDGTEYLRFAEADILATVHGADYIEITLPAVTKDRDRRVRT